MDEKNALVLDNFIRQWVNLSPDELTLLCSYMQPYTVKRRQLLLQRGHKADNMYFLTEGFVRFFTVNETDTEFTSDFYFAPGFLTSFTSFILQQPSGFSIQALMPMQIWHISYHHLNQLYSQSATLERLGRILTEQAFISSEKHLISLLTQTPTQRYQHLLKEYPQYIRHIPLRYLASYLAITPETLSRIRNRILS